MSKQILIVLGILLVFGCADVSKENQLQTGCSGDSESTPENVYVPPAPAPAPTPTDEAEVCTNYSGNSWPQQIGSCKSDGASAITTDSAGNVYIVGTTQTDFDNNTNAGDSDIFIVKYSSDGSKLWSKLIGTDKSEQVGDIFTDTNNNILIVGSTNGEFNGVQSNGNHDVLLIKLDSSGNQLWSKMIGTSDYDSGLYVRTDTSNNVLITGVSFGNFDGHTNANLGRLDIFVVKYSTNGTKIWSDFFGANHAQSDTVSGIATDSAGNVYLTGYTYGTIKSLANSGYIDTFTSKYNSDGTHQWIRKLANNRNLFGKSIAIDSSNNIYIGGEMPWGYSLSGHTSAGGSDSFLAKYDSNGNLSWTNQFGGSGNDYMGRISVDSLGNIYVAGATNGNIDSQQNNGDWDIFFLKFDGNKNTIWTKLIGTSSYDGTSGISISNSNQIYIAGSTKGVFGSNKNAGEDDIIILKYDTNGNLQ